MGASKVELFTENQSKIALIAKALGHPARIAILEQLLKSNACVCGDIVQHIGLAQATVSQHLKELKTAGLIKGNIDGQKVCYCINPVGLNAARQLLSEFLIEVDENLVCC